MSDLLSIDWILKKMAEEPNNIKMIRELIIKAVGSLVFNLEKDDQAAMQWLKDLAYQMKKQILAEGAFPNEGLVIMRNEVSKLMSDIAIGIVLGGVLEERNNLVDEPMLLATMLAKQRRDFNDLLDGI